MSAPAGSPISRALRNAALMASVLMACNLPCLGGAPADKAASLRDAYRKLIPRLDHNAFKRPLYLDSEESSSTLKGEVYAVMAYPFATVNGAFNDPARAPSNWCDALILHPNIKYCRATSGDGKTLIVNVSKKEVAEELSTTYRVQFEYDATTTGPGYLQVRLHAAQGPLNTRDYRIALEAVALGGDRTFLHLTYAYSYGPIGRLAMKTYLAAFGRGKVGFTDIADAIRRSEGCATTSPAAVLANMPESSWERGVTSSCGMTMAATRLDSNWVSRKSDVPLTRAGNSTSCTSTTRARSPNRR